MKLPTTEMGELIMGLVIFALLALIVAGLAVAASLLPGSRSGSGSSCGGIEAATFGCEPE